MRVTKLIREYVEETVSSMPKFKDKSAEELECKRVKDLLSGFLTDMNGLVEEYVKVKIAEFKTLHNIPDDIILEPTSYNCLRSNMFGCQLATQSDIKKKEREKARDNAIKEILLNLELGADRKELDEMLKKLAE